MIHKKVHNLLTFSLCLLGNC